MTTKTADQAFVREINLSIILNTLHDHTRISRARLAAITGLNKATVSRLIKELLDANFVREIGSPKGDDAGRPAILLELNPHAGYIIGAEIGVDFISVVLTNFAVEVHWRHQEQTSHLPNQEAILQRTLAIIHAALDHAKRDGQQILGLGLGVPGLVDVQSGALLFAPNLGWRDVKLRELLEHEFNFPIYVDNEANLAALGESRFGVARGCKNVLFITSGRGLGGGIVLNGDVWTGAIGLAGEVGHMTIALDGPQCNCGNRGCWETLVTEGAVYRFVREALTAGQKSFLSDLTHGDLDQLTIPLVVQAARSQDPVALDALKKTGQYLGVGLANLINAWNPEMIVLGGNLSLASEFLLPEINQVIEARSLLWSRRVAKILIAAYGSDACAMGGVTAVYHHILSEPRTVRKNGG
ncbi:MAG: ROK family transcriptional regulator [Chloroflexi bacterium]|nr:ROK family transcriptional regulator [Chloroflexota bacterium]